jgi:hypothetical protein
MLTRRAARRSQGRIQDSDAQMQHDRGQIPIAWRLRPLSAARVSAQTVPDYGEARRQTRTTLLEARRITMRPVNRNQTASALAGLRR